MFAIARASFRSITRSPSAVVFTLAFPLVFILVFGFIGGGGISVHVAVKKKVTGAILFTRHCYMCPL
jgi:hypothetical protein